MEFRFTKEQETFRKEVRTFLDKEWKGTVNAWNYGPDEDEESLHKTRDFEKKLAGKGWLTMAWPKEYGGLGVDQLTQLIFREECTAAGAPGAGGAGIHMLGPCLMIHGTEQQKKEYLPPIARAEQRWCQGFSEPGAGSDLAGLQTRAVRDGDDFVLNGTKIWTSGAQHADKIFILARTDADAPKHRGISFFLTDMSTPGISIQPIQQITNRSGFNQTFLDNVRIPRANIVGEENRGWYVATTLLDFERSGVARVATALGNFLELKRYVNETKVNGRRLIDEPKVRSAMADFAVGIEVGRWLAYRVAWMQSNGLVPNMETSQSKLYNSTLLQMMAHFGINMMGLYGQLHSESGYARLNGLTHNAYLGTVCSTVSGGANEIQRGIIASRGLGMPRG